MSANISADDRLEAWVALLQAQAAVVDGVESELVSSLGLPLAWHEVLVRLARAGGDGMRMQELARAVLLSKSGLTRLADRMEQAGLIERSACATDRRGTMATITPEGRRTLRRAGPVFVAAVERHFAGRLTETDLDALRAILPKLVGGSVWADEEACTTADLDGAEPAVVG